jgi:hypothetical protein
MLMVAETNSVSLGIDGYCQRRLTSILEWMIAITQISKENPSRKFLRHTGINVG